MRSNKVYSKRISLLFVTTIFSFSTLLVVFSPVTYGQEQAVIQQAESTGVATKATNVSLKSADSCKTSLATNDLATAKAYSKDRLDKRLNSTKVIEKSINTTYDGIDSTYKTKMSSIQSIINKYAKGSKAKVNKEDLIKAKPKMLKQTTETRKIIEKGIEGAQSGQTPQVVAGFTCDAIFQGAVYSKLVPNVRAQLKLDAIKMRNSLNQGRYTAINALYKENNSTLKSEKSGIDKLQNPKSYDNDIEALQSRINKGENVVKDVTSFGAIPKKSAPEITKQLSELTAKLREEKQSTSSERSSTGQNSGSGSSNGTSTPNKVIEKVTKRNEEGKATSGRYCHPHGSDTKHSCVSYGEGKNSGTRKQAVDKARKDAKKHDEKSVSDSLANKGDRIRAKDDPAYLKSIKNKQNKEERNRREAASKERARKAKAEKQQKQAQAKRQQQQSRDRRQYQKEQEQKRQKEKKQYEKDTKKVI